MSEEEKERLVKTIAGALGGASQEIIDRQLPHFDKADEDYGKRVREALKTANADDAAAKKAIR
jgi:catalase